MIKETHKYEIELSSADIVRWLRNDEYDVPHDVRLFLYQAPDGYQKLFVSWTKEVKNEKEK